MKPFLLALMVLVGGSTPAVAQTKAPSVFVTGGFFDGIERMSHSETIAPVPFSVDLSGTKAGGTVGVGTFLSERWSVRLELPVTSARAITFSPPAQPGAPQLPFTQQVHIDYRTRTGAVLLGYHTPMRHRVGVEYLAGLAFVQERTHTVVDTVLRFPVPFPPPLRTEGQFFTYRGAATAGVDVVLAITSHFAVVPQVRAQVFVGGLSIRPGVGARWSF